MKTLLHLLTLTVIALCHLDAAPPPAETTLTLLDGRALHDAKAKPLDNWTLSVTHEHGTASIPIALLTASDRTRLAPLATLDGRYWLERTGVLYCAWEAGGRKVPLPEAMAEVAPHAAAIRNHIQARDAARTKSAQDAAARQRAARAARLAEWETFTDPAKFREWTESVARARYLGKQ